MKRKIALLVLGFTLLIIIQFVSNCLINILHMSFPAPLLGLVVLAVLLYFKIIPERFIKDISELLLSNMALFFIPLLVGVVSYAHIIKQNLLSIGVIILITTFVTMITTAFLVEYVIKFIRIDSILKKKKLGKSEVCD